MLEMKAIEFTDKLNLQPVTRSDFTSEAQIEFLKRVI
jgi:hypothetical protein